MRKLNESRIGMYLQRLQILLKLTQRRLKGEVLDGVVKGDKHEGQEKINYNRYDICADPDVCVRRLWEGLSELVVEGGSVSSKAAANGDSDSGTDCNTGPTGC